MPLSSKPATTLLLFFVTWLFACSFAAAQQSTTVQLTNPGLEGSYAALGSGAISGQIAPGWQDNSAWAGATVQYSQETTNPHGGASCQKIVVISAGTGQAQFQQQFPLKAANIYTASVWMRGLPGSIAILNIQQAASPYTSYAQTSVSLTADWQLVQVQGYITTTESAQLMVAASSPGTIWVDDFAVSYTPGTAGPQPNLGPISPSFFGMHVSNYTKGTLRNPGFEPPYTGVGVNNGISGQTAVNWSDNSSWANPTVTYSMDTTNPHSGAACQKIAVQSPGSGAIQFAQQVTVIPEQTYTLSAWVRGDPGMVIHLLIREAAGTYASYTPGGYPSFTLTSDWQKITVTGLVHNTDGTPAGDVLLMFHTAATGAFFVDDVTFTDASGHTVSGGVPWPTAQFGTLRLWDSDTSWTWLEPQKGVWNWEPLDMWVAEAERHGVRDILLTLGQSPTWASSNPDATSYVGAGAPAPPANNQDWQDYITAVATRYRGRIRYYEIWNEPNDPTYYTGTVAELATLTKEASQILKAIDPGNTVVSPAPYVAGYLDQLLTAGIGPYVDMLAFHIYTYATLPETAGTSLAGVRLVMAKHGVGTTPLWDTEGASGDNTTSDTVSANYVVRRYLVDLAYGSVRFDYYAWGRASKFCPAMESTDPRTLTTTAKAYRYLYGWLQGASLTQVIVDAAGNWQLWFNWPGGRTGVIVWNPTQTTQLALPSSFAARSAHDLWGGVQPVSSSTVNVTGSPVFFASTSDAAPVVATVSNAAGAGNQIAPGSLAILTGTSLAGREQNSSFYPWLMFLGLADVNLGGIDCPLVYTSPGSIVFQVPSALAAGIAQLTISSPEGLSAVSNVAIAVAGPGIFKAGAHAIALNADGRVNTAVTPAAVGSTLLVYLTGIGPVSPAVNDGEAAPSTPLSAATLAASARIGTADAAVQSLTLTPGFAGLAQAAITVPALAAGDYPLVITVGGVTSQAATVSVIPAK